MVDARQRLEALAEVKARPDFVPLAVAFKRVANIQEKAGGPGAARVDPALLRDEAERRLLAELERVEAEAVSFRRAPRTTRPCSETSRPSSPRWRSSSTTCS